MVGGEIQFKFYENTGEWWYDSQCIFHTQKIQDVIKEW